MKRSLPTLCFGGFRLLGLPEPSLFTAMVQQVSSLHGTTVAFRWNVFLWLLFYCTTAHAGTFSTALDRNALRVGEQATLTLRFDGELPSGVPRLPDVPNLQFKFDGQSQQFAVINGQRTASLLLTYVVTADKPGDYTIPKFNVPVAGTILPSQPLSLKVHPADAKLPDTSVSTGDGQAQQSLVEIKERAERGDATAQVRLGELFRSGNGGVVKSYAQSVDWFMKAAQQGHIGAQIAVGEAYLTGFGVRQHLPEAYAWFNLAAVSSELAAKKRDALELQQPSVVQEGQTRTEQLLNQTKEKRPTIAPSDPPRTNTPGTGLPEPGDFGGAFNFGGSSGSHGKPKTDPLNDILKKAIAAGVFISIMLLVKFLIFGRK